MNFFYAHAGINECSEGNHDCHPDASCANTPAGSYSCTCKIGYQGTGSYCVGECYHLGKSSSYVLIINVKNSMQSQVSLQLLLVPI